MTDERELPASGAPFAVRTTRRRGRMSKAKRTALTDLLPRWSLPDPLAEPLTEARLREAFGRAAPRLLDVGVGTGEATLEWAEDHPDHDVVAVELHRPGIARLLQTLEADGPHNVRILETDVTRLLDVVVGPDAPPDRPRFDAVRVLFPDPWPKTRHHKRRLLRPDRLAFLASRLAPGGTLHVATDWAPYAEEARDAVDAEPLLVNPHGGFAPRPAHRPVTRFEERARAEGRPTFDLVAVRR